MLLLSVRDFNLYYRYLLPFLSQFSIFNFLSRSVRCGYFEFLLSLLSINTVKIVLENIHKSFGKRVIVNRVNISVAQGEIVGLLGPNGAGKTTTFYIATGLEKPNQGTVWLDNVDITKAPMHRRARLGIGYLAQEASVFRQLTVRDNILLVFEQTNVPRWDWSKRLNTLLREFRLEKVQYSTGIQLSGGERRRTELARSLAAGREGPKFLFLDEPFAGVDPIAVAEIQQIVAQLRDRNMGILITDHNVRETLAITDRAYIMREGQILASGTPDELYNNPLVRQYYLGDNFQV
jgi:lipopolysaccharide export system ATP-binding protein